MNARERVLIALDHGEPDRVPVDLWFTSEVEAILSAQHDGLRGAALRVALGHDLLMTSSPNIGASYEVPGSPAEYVCDWGVRWQWVTNPEGGRYTEAIGHPLATVKDLSDYHMPDPLGPAMQPIYAEARDLVRRYGGRTLSSAACTRPFSRPPGCCEAWPACLPTWPPIRTSPMNCSSA